MSPSEPSEQSADESIKGMITEHLDEIDYEIYRILNENGRISDTELGDRVGLSRTAVRRRRKRLQEENIIKIIAVLQMQAVDLDYADVHVSLTPDATCEETDDFLEFLLEEELVYEVDEYLGRTDMLVRVWHTSLREIKDYVNELMHYSDVVEEYEIIPVVETHKDWHSEIDG